MRKTVYSVFIAVVLICAAFTFAQTITDSKRLTDEEAKQGEQFEAGVKQATDVLNATLSASVQGSFDATSALEAIGRIRVAYLSLENAKLAREVWASRLQAEKECNKCEIDLKAKVIKRSPKENVVKRE